MFDEPLISACNLAGNIVSGCQSVEDINGALFTSQLAARAEMVGGGGGVPAGQHNSLTGRDEENCHPQAAITGLVTALSGKVDKETGKGLSTNDYTTAEKNKLAGIEDGAQVNPDLSGYALTSDVNIALSGKVDKVAGKDLSTNDFTDDLKALLEQLVEELDALKMKRQELTDAETVTWDSVDGNIAFLTLGGNRAIANITNPVVGRKYRIYMRQDATGNRKATWGNYYHFSGGRVPDTTATANAVDFFEFECTEAHVFSMINFVPNIKAQL